MIDYDNLEEFRDPLTYDLECDEVDEEVPLIEHWAQSLGGPLLDIACGTGRTAIRLAVRGYQVVGVDLVPEMIARGREKADEQGVSIEWAHADARDFHLHKQFSCIYMVGNAFQFFLTRADQEALLARVVEHLSADGIFLFETRNPSPRNLFGLFHPDPQTFNVPDGRTLVITEEQHYEPLTQIQHYTSQYHWSGPGEEASEKTKRVALRYVYPQEIEALLHYNGLEIHASYGRWQQEPLTAASREMIYACRRRG